MNTNFKLAVFDLDYTLWNGLRLFNDVKKILSTMKSIGIKLYVASFHTDARKVCEMLQIDHFFDDILYGTGPSKLDMINIIIGCNNDVKDYEVVFFDDNICNIMDVRRKSNILTVHIDDKGITWDDIENNGVLRTKIILSRQNNHMSDIEKSKIFHSSGEFIFEGI